ncbi:atypical chemokine receptor 4 isoform X2 [Pangasianodon hypophthalmus]|uniref:atypical chemokine receptor 4 isoform X2 n=1 Tax=Pangasianodon hypophthalmus TaxID=310915 RepID=UPI000EFEDAEB|nr:atypical chemokine receptor 4 isoform X2 [Pangasianodon hypophthalmus]
MFGKNLPTVFDKKKKRSTEGMSGIVQLNLNFKNNMDYTDDETYDIEENDNFSYYNYSDYETVCEKEDVRSFARVFLPIVYGLSLLVGLTGNALVVAVYAYSKRLRTLMDTFVVHLAVADLLLLLTLPFWAAAAVHGWELGEVLCKIVTALYTINFTCSMLLLACISLDRYLSLFPRLRDRFLVRIFKRNYAAKLCLVVWTVSFFLGIPDLVLSKVKEHPSRKVCMTMYPSSMAIQAKVTMEVIEVLLSFLVPLLMMLYCYFHVVRKLLELPPENRGKRWTTIRVLLAVVGVFVLTQFPYNIVKFCRVLDVIHMFIRHCQTSKALDQAAQITESMALIHCCLNPVLYVFIGSSFRIRLLRFAKAFGQRRRLAQRGEECGVEISVNSHSQSQKTSSFSI